LAREKLQLTLEAAHERQQYLLGGGIVGIDARRDIVERAQAKMVYTPRRWLEWNVTFGKERRQSNHDIFAYDDWTASAGIKVNF